MDLDADGYPDILSGSYSRMGPTESMAGLIQVLYGKPDGTFREAQVLNGTDGNPLIIPKEDSPPATPKDERWIESICTRPFAVDWDGDGRLDLLVGNFPGRFYLFKGEGKGRFRPKPEVIKSGAAPLKIEGYHGDPFVVDWNGDGAFDLVSGSEEGGVQWAKNLAPKGKPPQFAKFEWLIRPGRRINYGELAGENELTGPTAYTRVWVADVNGDGKLDLLVGDCLTLTSPAKGVTPAQYQERFAASQKAFDALNKEWAAMMASEKDKTPNHGKASDTNKTRREEFNQKRNELNLKRFKLIKQRERFMNSQRTGFVWLYLQK